MRSATQPTSQPFVIPLWPGGAPGSESWTQVETLSTMRSGLKVIRNVVQPTLTAYLPDPQIATGTAVIICQGLLPSASPNALPGRLVGADLLGDLEREHGEEIGRERVSHTR